AEGRDEFVRYFEGAVDLGDTVGEGAGAGEDWVTRRLEAVNTATERLIWAQGSPKTLKAVSTIIRGVRVNMAAAICWENYMPLLRQALYAQNINLYLAPTADGRDAWVSAMRSIGIEGRCFVLSSNMCVREGGGGDGGSTEALPTVAANGSPPATAGGGGEGRAAAAAATAAADASPYGRERRSSCVTEEGFEIALPTHSAQGAGKSPETRRPSVLDENGNEIVLCGAEGGNSAPAVTNGVQNAEPVKKTADGGKFISRGGSCITDPFGEVLAGPQWEDDTGIIYADVDLKDCIRGRLDLDAGGSYSRNDSFKFSVEGLNLEPLPY
ncbi:carbon-nitrogen hydrolase, partial [Diaporthe helianthi]